ncbi:MAG: hypothetical protein ACJATD_000452 [Alloalcanivorax sp.]|jgi:hypothetical protein
MKIILSEDFFLSAEMRKDLMKKYFCMLRVETFES